jgi:phage terminase large subunit
MELLLKQNHAVYYLNDETTTEVLFGGGAGGGKSALGCLWIISVCQKYPGIRTMIGRSKLKALNETTLNTFFQLTSNLGISNQYKYDSQKNLIKWHNGSVILLKDLFLYPADPEFDSLGSLEITYSFIDECNQIVLKAWQVAKSRLRYRLRDFAPNGELTKNLKIHAWEYVNGNYITKEYSNGKKVTYDYSGEEEVICEKVDKDYKKFNKIPCEWYQSDGKITKGLIGKQLGTCNPAKNWTYSDFYNPSLSNTLKPFRKFVQALPKDNPHLPKSYIDNLKSMDMASRKRLLEGDWNYDDNPYAMFEYSDILAMFTNDWIKPNNDKYMTCDIAYTGSDKFVIIIWNGFVVTKVIAIDKIDDTMISKKIHDLRIEHRVPVKNVLYDADGLQTFTRYSSKFGTLSGAIGFKNNSRPIKVSGKIENFRNLKAQSYFYFSDMVKDGKILIQDKVYSKQIIEEFEQINRKPLDDDGLISMEKKSDVRERLKRSPDFADAIMMRAYFEIKGKPKPRIFW